MKFQIIFTKQEERFLMELGLETLINSAMRKPAPTEKKSAHKWTSEQRKKFKATMKAKFAEDSKK